MEVPVQGSGCPEYTGSTEGRSDLEVDSPHRRKWGRFTIKVLPIGRLVVLRFDRVGVSPLETAPEPKRLARNEARYRRIPVYRSRFRPDKTPAQFGRIRSRTGPSLGPASTGSTGRSPIYEPIATIQRHRRIVIRSNDSDTVLRPRNARLRGTAENGSSDGNRAGERPALRYFDRNQAGQRAVHRPRLARASEGGAAFHTRRTGCSKRPRRSRRDDVRTRQLAPVQEVGGQLVVWIPSFVACRPRPSTDS